MATHSPLGLTLDWIAQAAGGFRPVAHEQFRTYREGEPVIYGDPAPVDWRRVRQEPSRQERVSRWARGLRSEVRYWARQPLRSLGLAAPVRELPSPYPALITKIEHRWNVVTERHDAFYTLESLDAEGRLLRQTNVPHDRIWQSAIVRQLGVILQPCAFALRGSRHAASVALKQDVSLDAFPVEHRLGTTREAVRALGSLAEAGVGMAAVVSAWVASWRGNADTDDEEGPAAQAFAEVEHRLDSAASMLSEALREFRLAQLMLEESKAHEGPAVVPVPEPDRPAGPPALGAFRGGKTMSWPGGPPAGPYELADDDPMSGHSAS